MYYADNGGSFFLKIYVSVVQQDYSKYIICKRAQRTRIGIFI